MGAGDVLVVSQVDISPPDVSLIAGNTQQLQANPKTSSGISVPGRQVTWSSDDLGVATVSTSGMVTGVAPGNTQINAAVDGVRGSIQIAVTPKPVATVSVVPDQVSLLVGESQDVTAIPRDADGQPVSGHTTSFTSDNPLIATVTPTGHVTGVAPGLTVVRATAGGKTGTANIAVNALPASQLDFQTEPATGSAGQPLPPVRIAVQNDQGGTVTEGSIPVSLDLGANPTGAVLSGTRVVNAVNGVATFNDLRVNEAGVGYTLRASSGTLTPAESAPFAVVAGTAARLGITTQPSPLATSGAPLARQPVIQVQDAGGNAVAKSGVQVTAALQGAGGTLGGTRTITTNAQGVAAFTNLAITGEAGAYTILFAATGLTAIASNVVTIAGSAAVLVMVEQPSETGQSGVALDRQPVVQLQDAGGNSVPQSGLAVTASINTGGGSLGGSVTVLTDASGRAAFTNLAIIGLAGARTLRFSAASVASAVSNNVVLVPGSPVGLAFATNPPPTTASGDALSPAPSVRVVDAAGNPVPPAADFPMTVTIASGNGGTLGGTTTVQTSGGAATFNGLTLSGPNGPYTLRFSGGGYTPVVSPPIVIGAGTPVGLAIVTQPSPSVESGSALAVQPVIGLHDGVGNPAPQSGVTVTVSIASGGGTLGGTLSRTTDANGRATFTDLVITGQTGARTLRFESGGLAGVTSSSITVTAAPPSKLTIVTQPSASTESGVALAQQPVIRVSNKFDEPVSGVTLTATISSGPSGASISGNTAQSNANGLATFSGLTLTGDKGDYTIRFATGNLTVVSGAIRIIGKPAALVLTTGPAGAASGVALQTQPVVQIVDKDGEPVEDAGLTITAVIASSPGGGSLSNATAVSDALGAARFSGLALSGVVGSYSLRFTSGALTPVTSGSFSLGPGLPATLTLPTQPPNQAENDRELGDDPIVRVQDGAGNVVPDVSVSVALASGAGTLKGTLTRLTGENGRATFNNLEIVGLVGPYTLVFSAGGATVTSRTITLSAGNEEVLTIQVEPSASAKSGENFGVQPKVELRDTGGNLVTRDGVEVRASLETVSGLGSLGGDNEVDTNNGVASFSSLRIHGTGTFRLRFSSNGMTGVTSTVITVTVL